MIEVEVPDRFAASTVAREGAAGREWIHRLPGIVADLCERWRLTPDGPATHGRMALVVPVRKEGVERVLKVSWRDEASQQESLALRLWEGRGAVRLIDEDAGSGAMLLERLDHRRTLESVPIRRAVRIAGELLRRLAIPPTPEVRTVDEEIAGLRQDLPALWEATGRPFPGSLLDRVLGLMGDLAPPPSALIVDADLHFGNVLGGDREPWLVIDPKILAGDLEFGAAQLLWSRFEELRTPGDVELRLSLVSDAAALDIERARAWSIVRIVEYWLRASSVGLTGEAGRARRLIEWLA